jgi:glycosyltransferase involved in cell wall biosynthesis
MSTKIKIAVCLLSFNHEKTISSVVDSILKQNGAKYKFYLSDDSSTDGSWGILQAFKNQGHEITLLKTPHNYGMAGNANYAFQFIDEPYVALLHHDDICAPDLLAEWASVLDLNPSVGFVFNQYGVYGSDFVYRENFASEVINGNKFIEDNLFSSWGCIVRGTAMIRKSFWDQAGGMQPKYGLLADIDLWMRLSMISDVGYVAKPLLYVQHSRPDDYPEEYCSEVWSWKRLKFLYDIHANNFKKYWGCRTLMSRLRWFNFRLRLNLETMKWLLYAFIRSRRDMLKTCQDSQTQYDFLILRMMRVLATFYCSIRWGRE